MDTMFFSHFVVAKKGPLARIWLAAHWDKKLTKAHILEINIERSVEGILQPKIKLALRTSGHLLLGVVRIYSRKAKYLLAECNEAFVKIKMAFRPGIVDLPEGNREAALAAITLPEVFHDFENIGDITIEVNTPTTLHQSRAEDITLKEDYGALSLMGEDAFGDMGFDDAEMARDATNIDEDFDHTTGLLVQCEKEKSDEGIENDDEMTQVDHPPDASFIDVNVDITSKTENDMLAAGDVGFFETGLFTDAPAAPISLNVTPEDAAKEPQSQPELSKNLDMSDEDTYCGPPSVGLPSGPSSPESVAHDEERSVNEPANVAVPRESTLDDCLQDADTEHYIAEQAPVVLPAESETFALAPLDSAVHKGVERTRNKRKRKLIVDEVKNISGEEMKAQLSDTRDIINTLDLAPPTKRLMHWKESGGVEKLFALPGHCLQSTTLSRLYLRHLTTRPIDDERFEIDEHYPSLEDMATKEIPSEMRPAKRQRCTGPEELPLEEMITEQEPPPPPPPPPPVPELPEEPPLPVSAPVVASPPQNEYNLNPVVSDAVSAEVEPKEKEENVVQVAPNDVTIPETASHDDLQATTVFETPENASLPAENVPDSASAAAAPAPCDQQENIDAEKSDDTQITGQNTSTEALFDQLSNNRQLASEETDVFASQDKEQPNILALDDDDDYHNPASVGVTHPEEQMADETYEQFEERIHSKRANHMLNVMKSNLDAGNKIPFSALTKGNKRKQAAQKFYTCLVLKKQQAIELVQDSAYGEVYVSRGPQLESLFQ